MFHNYIYIKGHPLLIIIESVELTGDNYARIRIQATNSVLRKNPSNHNKKFWKRDKEGKFLI